jgi:hypothetical protein
MDIRVAAAAVLLQYRTAEAKTVLEEAAKTQSRRSVIVSGMTIP